MKLLAECCFYLRFFIFQYGKNIVLLEMITAIDTQCIKHKHELGNLISNNLYLCFRSKTRFGQGFASEKCVVYMNGSHTKIHK